MNANDLAGGRGWLVNDSDISEEMIERAIEEQYPEIATLTKWNSTVHGRNRKSTLFDRDRYVTPTTIFDQFKTAQDAATNDDVVSGVVETTEQLAFKRIAIESDDADEEYVWNSIADDLDLAQRMREIWRDLFILSQCYVSVMWGRKTVRVDGKTDAGNKKKKVYKDLLVPTGISLLDPCKVLPIGNFMFNQEMLLYMADRGEANQIDRTLAGANTSDLIVNQLLTEKYIPSDSEMQYLREVTGDNLIENSFYKLNPDRVWRITSTRPQYQRFASCRMVSVFELLDMKHQLREMDRAHILGAANFIILVKKGSDQYPGKPQEIQQLASQLRTSSRVPLIVGDHRIEIEIITPKLDKTLSPERYNALDSRITARLYQILNTGSYSAGTGMDDSMKLLKVVAASMEARRDSIRESLMDHVFDQMYERNDQLKVEPKMQFYPRRVALDFDPNIATYLQDLRDRGDISRETILAELDILEADEAIKRKREADMYDDIFGPVNVPFSSTVTDGQKKAAGRAGGGSTGGGGTNSASISSNPGRKPSSSTPGA